MMEQQLAQIADGMDVVMKSPVPSAIAQVCAKMRDELIAAGFTRTEALQIMTVPGGVKFLSD